MISYILKKMNNSDIYLGAIKLTKFFGNSQAKHMNKLILYHLHAIIHYILF